MTTPAANDTRTRVLRGARQAVERSGLAKTSVEDVARTAGVSRATIYRYFPGGRDEMVTETIRWEVENFLTRIVDAVEDRDSLDEKLEEALLVGHRFIGDHVLLQRLLSTEPEEIIRELAEIGPVMRDAIAGYIGEELRTTPLRDGTDVAEAADYCARLFLSYIGSHGATDLGDPTVVARIVATQFLAGIVEPPIGS